MTEGMKRFSPDAKCVKCGWLISSTIYCGPRQVCDRLGGQIPPDHDVAVIHRRCGLCGYQWNELPLDAPESAGVTTADDIEPGPDYPLGTPDEVTPWEEAMKVWLIERLDSGGKPYLSRRFVDEVCHEQFEAELWVQQHSISPYRVVEVEVPE